MSDEYDVTDHYWLVAGRSDFYSSRLRQYVPGVPADFLLRARPTRIASEAELMDVLAAQYPAGLPVGAAEPADNKIALPALAERLRNRIASIDKLAQGPVVAFPAGTAFCPLMINAVALSTIAAAANRFDAAPFAVATETAVNAVGLEVTTAATGAQFVMGLYTDDHGVPGSLLGQTSALDAASTGFKAFVLPQNVRLVPWQRYWVVVHSSAAPTYRGIPVAGMAPLGISFANGTALLNIARTTLAWSATMPARAPAVGRVSAVFPAVLLRAA